MQESGSDRGGLCRYRVARVGGKDVARVGRKDDEPALGQNPHGLQDHGQDCWYKNIKLLPLK